MDSFIAYTLTDDPSFKAALTRQSLPPLPLGEVRIQVAYSDINYKDALASTPKGGVIRSYPMVPGVDLSGTVIESKDSRFNEGDSVIATGYGLGVTRPGGFSQIQDVPADWLVPLPESLTLKEAMMFGTAGLTAALAIEALEQQGAEKHARIVITGASGGVGSAAIAMLHALGYTDIIALSRKATEAAWLKELGASAVVAPADFLPEKRKALGKQSLEYLIDTVGGTLLSDLLPLIAYGGAAALCGNAGGVTLETTVLPFILRGIHLIGIDSVQLSHEKRVHMWQRLATEMNVADRLTITEDTFDSLEQTIQSLLEGTHQGRTILRVEADE